MTGKCYLVEESHCSCNGLSTWEPEEITVSMMESIGKSGNGLCKEACQYGLRTIEELNLLDMPPEHISVALKLRFG